MSLTGEEKRRFARSMSTSSKVQDLFSLPLHALPAVDAAGMEVAPRRDGMGKAAAAFAPFLPWHPWPGTGREQESALSLRQRPHFSQNSQTIYVPRCPDDKWTPLFLSSGWYFNGRLTGKRSKGAICLFFFPLKRLQKCTLAFGFCNGLKEGTGPIMKPQPGISESPGVGNKLHPAHHSIFFSLYHSHRDARHLTGIPEMPRPDSTQVHVDAIPTEVNKSSSHPPLSKFSTVPAPNPREGRRSTLYLEHSCDMLARKP